MLKDDLLAVARSQREDLGRADLGLEREALAGARSTPSFALVITGVRRCGKSTLLRQMMGTRRGACYLRFDDPRLAGFEAADLARLEGVVAGEYGGGDDWFLDEVQDVGRWELMVRFLLDRGRNVVVTGSNASLLSREQGTRLTGRHLDLELFPFSYGEFLRFKDVASSPSAFGAYLAEGGFPERLRTGDPDVLRQLLGDVLARDIAVRHGIRNIKTLREMALHLLTNASKEFSYNSLRGALGLGSVNTAISFVSHFEDSYMLFTVPRLEGSAGGRLSRPLKAYAVDTGLSAACSLSLSEDTGRALENAVFLALRRRHREVCYHRGRRECDFVVREGRRATAAVQACAALDGGNEEREVAGLLEAMERFGLREGTIVTLDQADELRRGGRRIRVVPGWRWMG